MSVDIQKYYSESPITEGRKLIEQVLRDLERQLMTTARAVEAGESRMDRMENEITEVKTTLASEVYLKSFQAANLSKQVKARVKELDGKTGLTKDQLFSRIWSRVKDAFGVTVYKEIPRIHYEVAMKIVAEWEPILQAKEAV